jgi:sphingomyelin phosphodiesterase
VVYDLFKRTLGGGPVYVTLGNHDSYDQCALLFADNFEQLLMPVHHRAQDAPHSLGGDLANQFSWSAPILILSSRRPKDIIFYRNYDHVASLWKLEQWLPDSVVSQARSHYAAYSVQRTDGLRIISLNTDLCKCRCVSRVGLCSH